jgi:Rieske Fe-S protein
MTVSRRTLLAGSGGALGLCLLPGCSSGGDGDGGTPPDLALPPDLLVPDLRSCPGIDSGLASDVMTNCAVLVTDNQTYGFFLCRDAGGLYAVTGICTHAGCLVNPVSSCSTTRTPFFNCPCHGSQFAYDGTLLRGPALAPLDHLALCVTPDGNCGVDPNTVVDPSTRL